MDDRLHYGTPAKVLHWLVVALLTVQFPIGWFMPDVQVAAGESQRGTGGTTITSRISVGRKAGFDCDHGARNRHSDNEKFCNDLNRPKTPKMSEWPLKTLQDFPTSKLNTRVRFPPPAPRFSGTCWALLFPFGQALLLIRTNVRLSFAWHVASWCRSRYVWWCASRTSATP
jgi:hypothetical protein